MALLVVRDPTHEGGFELEIRSDGLEDFDGFRRDFGADSVTGKHCNSRGHEGQIVARDRSGAPGGVNSDCTGEMRLMTGAIYVTPRGREMSTCRGESPMKCPQSW